MKAIIFISVSLLVAISSVFYWMANKDGIKAQETISEKQEDKISLEDLIVIPQIPKDKVVVESVTLNKKGFLVARKMEGDKLGQVIEMSKPLGAGTHKNIEIPLGSVDVSSSELIVMIYEDYDNDGVFNDLDMPALNGEGLMTARYVKTGKPLPASIAEAGSGIPAHSMPGMKSMAKIRYTDKGFVPDKIEVPEGSMVEFINESSMDMWVASADHPAHQKLPTFDQFRMYKKGAIYRYVFEQKGTWEFHDHISPSLGGVVTVN
jgi:plastocyanin